MILNRGLRVLSLSSKTPVGLHASNVQGLRLDCLRCSIYARGLHSRPASQETFGTSKRDDWRPDKYTTHPVPIKRKAVRNPGNPSSLRKVTVQNDRSGERQRHRSLHERETRVVTAYCAADTYRLDKAAEILTAAGHRLDPDKIGLYPQVIHFQTAPRPDDPAQRPGDVFVFTTGTVVAWAVDQAWIQHLISATLLPAAEGTHLDRLETEDLEYLEDATSERSSITGDTIRIGTKPPSPDTDNNRHHETPAHTTSLALCRLAFSSGLARSTKLAVLESLLDNYFASTAAMPVLLSSGTRLPYSRAFVLRKTGELLAVRSALNLSSELTDSLPDLFWDAEASLGLEQCFETVQRALDVRVRIRTLNERLDYAQDIAAVLRETLGERHGFRLEWAIIVLIVVEVGFEGWRAYAEMRERRSAEGTEALLRRWLKSRLQDEDESA